MNEAQRVRESCGLADCTWMVKFDVKGLGLKVPPAPDAPCACWQLGRGHYLVTSETSHQEAARAWIHSLEQPVYCTNVTSVYADLLLAGPSSREVLSKLTALDVTEAGLPNLSCGQTSLAHVHAIVLRQDLGVIPTFHLLVGRDVGESVREALLHAGEEYHIVPFGFEARALI